MIEGQQPVGNRYAIRRAQKVIASPLLGAAYAQPHGNMQRAFASLAGPIVGHLAGRRIAPSALPQTVLLALDNSQVYLFDGGLFRKLREVARAPHGSYRASATDGTIFRRLMLDLPNFGSVDIDIGVLAANRANAKLIDLIVARASV